MIPLPTKSDWLQALIAEDQPIREQAQRLVEHVARFRLSGTVNLALRYSELLLSAPSALTWAIEQGWLELLGGRPECLTATAKGRAVVGRPGHELHGPTPGTDAFSPEAKRQLLAVESVAVALEIQWHEDFDVLDEDQLRALQQRVRVELGKERYLTIAGSAGQLQHLPALVLYPRKGVQELPVAIEVFTQAVAREELAQIIDGFAGCPDVQGVWCYVVPCLLESFWEVILSLRAQDDVILYALRALGDASQLVLDGPEPIPEYPQRHRSAPHSPPRQTSAGARDRPGPPLAGVNRPQHVRRPAATLGESALGKYVDPTLQQQLLRWLALHGVATVGSVLDRFGNTRTVVGSLLDLRQDGLLVARRAREDLRQTLRISAEGLQRIGLPGLEPRRGWDYRTELRLCAASRVATLLELERWGSTTLSPNALQSGTSAEIAATLRHARDHHGVRDADLVLAAYRTPEQFSTVVVLALGEEVGPQLELMYRPWTRCERFVEVLFFAAPGLVRPLGKLLDAPETHKQVQIRPLPLRRYW